jgi:hypothetical protein
MARRRGFGEVERRVSRSGEVTYRARSAMPDGTRFSRTLATKLDAEAWLAAERALTSAVIASGSMSVIDARTPSTSFAACDDTERAQACRSTRSSTTPSSARSGIHLTQAARVVETTAVSNGHGGLLDGIPALTDRHGPSSVSSSNTEVKRNFVTAGRLPETLRDSP